MILVLENQPAAGKESLSVLFELLVNPKFWGNQEFKP
jgi:hypothetical protein